MGVDERVLSVVDDKICDTTKALRGSVTAMAEQLCTLNKDPGTVLPDTSVSWSVSASWQLADRDDLKTKKKKKNQYCVHTPDRTHSSGTTDDDK